jgi:lambda family phage minor tail protein L
MEDLANPLYSGSLTWEERAAAVPIIWNGQSYKAWPCQVEGLEINSSGQPNNPTLSVGNIDGTISSLCLFFQDLVQAKVIIRRTMAEYLDAINFVGGNPSADPTQEYTDTWYIDSKSYEDNETVSFTLSSPADLSGKKLPGRLYTGVCEWAQRGQYRGPNCNYTGTAMFDINNNPTSDPSEDRCAGRVPSCKARFGQNAQLNIGAFPSANLLGK